MFFSRLCQLSIPEHVHFVVFDEKDGFPASATLLNYESGEFYALDGVGLDFWYLLQDKQSLEEIVATLMSTYEITAETLWRDIEALVESLLEKGILTCLDASG